ncbi:MAG: extracellular solute-binding protein [Tissierellales bacterium]
MRKKSFTLIFIFFFIMIIIIGCNNSIKVNSKNPITLNLWHNYGGQLRDTMDNMIDEFNETIGSENGIVINITSISGSSTLHEKLVMAANDDPGAPTLPDITSAYPKTALVLAKKGLLANLNQQFTTDELSKYIPEFLQEGQLHDDGLYVFPTAKSTEVLFVNTILFNKFASNTGVKLEDLQTIEGIIELANLYYVWTDEKTPHIENDGKMFFMADSLFNYSLLGCKQLGGDFIINNSINLHTAQYNKVWKNYFNPAALGQVAIFDGYATDLAKTGDIVCSTGSTAGISFYPTTVTYADNTTEPIELTILPYPVFEGGSKTAIQRGAGMSVIKSSKEKEHAAGIFLKWFTKPENNIRFISSTGYLPVSKEAFGELMSREIDSVSDENIKKLLIASKIMQKEYTFYIPPLFDGVDELQKQYENKLRETALEGRQAYTELLNSMDSEMSYDAVFDQMYNEIINYFP